MLRSNQARLTSSLYFFAIQNSSSFSWNSAPRRFSVDEFLASHETQSAQSTSSALLFKIKFPKSRSGSLKTTFLPRTIFRLVLTQPPITRSSPKPSFKLYNLERKDFLARFHLWKDCEPMLSSTVLCFIRNASPQAIFIWPSTNFQAPRLYSPLRSTCLLKILTKARIQIALPIASIWLWDKYIWARWSASM